MKRKEKSMLSQMIRLPVPGKYCLAGAIFWVACTAASARGNVDAQQARALLEESGIQGGLVVHVPCGDGALTEALRVNRHCLVHGLDTDRKRVEQARRRLSERGVYGPVSVDVFNGEALPYTDNTVNFLLCSDKSNLSDAEVMRVLVPRGVACIRTEKGWSRKVKPWPEDIDEWTHYMYDATGNAVSHDRQVGPPRSLKWQCGPRWSRHHDHMASMSAMVSARGRIFYIIDEGSRISPQLPTDWKLVARDGFNGVLLWKRSIPDWHPHLWPLKSGPANLPRRLVASGPHVFATLGVNAPAVALDAATGAMVRAYKDTHGAEELLVRNGRLFVLVNPESIDLAADLAVDPEQGASRDSRTTYSPYMGKIWAGVRSRRWSNAPRRVCAFSVETGEKLWEHAGKVLPLTLAADGGHVYFHDGQRIVALSQSTGKPAWASASVPVWKGLHGQGLQSWFAPTLVVNDGKVLFAGGEKTHMSYMGWGAKDIGQDTMTCLSADTGKPLWTGSHPYSGYNSPEDLFVINKKVWVGNTAQGGANGRYASHDLATGEAVDDFPPTVNTYWFHHRCYRAKATDRYILSSRTGIEFVDVQTGNWDINHWVRGGCLYGIMPANGLVYAPPHPCACYPESKLNGLAALTAGSAATAEPVAPENRLERGPAYGSSLSEENEAEADWPTYRHDPARSGVTASTVSAQLQAAWDMPLGGRISQPVSGEGKVYIADRDGQAVYALDAASGRKQWCHVAEGRIDSPPTYYRGMIIFGSAAGYVTALRAADGVLAWRFLAAPSDLRMVAFDRLESLWPLNGTVLVQNDVVTAVAGRSRFLDGGLRLCRLDVKTGKRLSETVLDAVEPETGQDLQSRVKGLNMPVALPDILASDGKGLYMRSQALDLMGNPIAPGAGKAVPDHLFAAYGFTDDSWFHRTYWLYGKSFSGGVGGFGNARTKPAGFILANNETTVFGYGRKPDYFKWASIADYHLFACPISTSASSGMESAPTGILFKNSPSLDPKGKALTVSAWIKTKPEDGVILVRGANLNGFALVLLKGKPALLVRTGNKTHRAVSRTPVGDDWTHVAGVLHPDGNMQVVVNGDIAGKSSGAPLLKGEPSIPMKVGYDDTQQLLPKPIAPFSGMVDEIRLYRRALLPEELKQLAGNTEDAAAGKTEGLALHLDFAKGKARDRSPHGNHGAIQPGKTSVVEGPFGKALSLAQPEKVNWQRSRRSGKSRVNFAWTCELPIMARALACSKDVLFAAGPPDMLEETDAFQQFGDPAVQKKIVAQAGSLKGEKGALLLAVGMKTGKILGRYPLASPPVFDGISIAGGRVYVACENGRIVAYREK